MKTLFMSTTCLLVLNRLKPNVAVADRPILAVDLYRIVEGIDGDSVLKPSQHLKIYYIIPYLLRAPEGQLHLE